MHSERTMTVIQVQVSDDLLEQTTSDDRTAAKSIIEQVVSQALRLGRSESIYNDDRNKKVGNIFKQFSLRFPVQNQRSSIGCKSGFLEVRK